jgi:hypothetical protein
VGNTIGRIGQPPGGAAFFAGTGTAAGSIGLGAAVESETTVLLSAGFVVAVVLAGRDVLAPGTVDPTATAVVDAASATVVAVPADVDEPPTTVVGVPTTSDVVGPETGTEVAGPDVAGPEVAGPDVAVCESTGVGTVVAVGGAGATDDAEAGGTDDAGAGAGELWCAMDGIGVSPPDVACASAGAAAAHASATIDEIVRTVLRAMANKIGGFSAEVRQDAV